MNSANKKHRHDHCTLLLPACLQRRSITITKRLIQAMPLTVATPLVMDRS